MFLLFLFLVFLSIIIFLLSFFFWSFCLLLFNYLIQNNSYITWRYPCLLSYFAISLALIIVKVYYKSFSCLVNIVICFVSSRNIWYNGSLKLLPLVIIWYQFCYRCYLFVTSAIICFQRLPLYSIWTQSVYNNDVIYVLNIVMNSFEISSNLLVDIWDCVTLSHNFTCHVLKVFWPEAGKAILLKAIISFTISWKNQT